MHHGEILNVGALANFNVMRLSPHNHIGPDADHFSESNVAIELNAGCLESWGVRHVVLPTRQRQQLGSQD